MRLALSVRMHLGLPCASPRRKEFSHQGGSIGRGPDNDLVLEDSKRIVSGRHARIRFQDGAFYLDDVSTNGVYVNGAAEPVGTGRSVRLADGDQLGIGDYVVAVEIESVGEPERMPAPERRSESFDIGDPFAEDEGGEAIPFGGVGEKAPPPPLLGRTDAVDPLELLGGGPARTPIAPAPGAVHDHLPAEHAHFQPPRAVVETIPDDWDQSGVVKAPSAPSAPPPRPTPAASGPPPLLPDDWDVSIVPSRSTSPPPAERVDVDAGRARETLRPPVVEERSAPRPTPAAPSGSAVQALASAAGLPAASSQRPADELMQDAGKMLREMVAGLMELLAARASFKSEFRIDATMIRPVENNPLKFAKDPQEALGHLLIPSGKAYLEPARAVREAIQDIKDHKVAMMAAMRTALQSLLRRFRPDELEARFQQSGKRSSLIGLSGKGRYWDMYRELFTEMEQDIDTLFRDVFGDEFVRAYEAQIQALAKSRR